MTAEGWGGGEDVGGGGVGRVGVYSRYSIILFFRSLVFLVSRVMKSFLVCLGFRRVLKIFHVLNKGFGSLFLIILPEVAQKIQMSFNSYLK